MSNLQEKHTQENSAQNINSAHIPNQYLNRTSSTPVGNELQTVQQIQQIKNPNNTLNFQPQQPQQQLQQQSSQGNSTEVKKPFKKLQLKSEQFVQGSNTQNTDQSNQAQIPQQQPQQQQLNSLSINPQAPQQQQQQQVKPQSTFTPTNINGVHKFGVQNQTQQPMMQAPFYQPQQPQQPQLSQISGQHNQSFNYPQKQQQQQFKQYNNQQFQPQPSQYNQSKPFQPIQQNLGNYQQQQQVQPQFNIVSQISPQQQPVQPVTQPSTTLDPDTLQKKTDTTVQKEKKKMKLNTSAQAFTPTIQLQANNIVSEPVTQQPQTEVPTTQQVQTKPEEQVPQVQQQPQQPAKKAGPVMISGDLIYEILKELLQKGTKTEDIKNEDLLKIINREKQVIDSQSNQDGRQGKSFRSQNHKKNQYYQGQQQTQQNSEEGQFTRSQRLTQQSGSGLIFDQSFQRAPLDPQKQMMVEKQKQWVEQLEKSKQDKNSEAAVHKEMKLNLNKLTADNFEILKQVMLQQAQTSKSNCEALIQFIIEKAWTEKKFVPIYAKLCQFIQEKQIQFNESGEGQSKNDKKNAFKSSLLQKIQHAFESQEVNIKNKKKFEELNKEEQAAYNDVKKKRIFGNVEFIGELLLNKVLSRQVIYICSLKMMQDFSDRYQNWMVFKNHESKNYEEYLEGIIVLMNKVGKQIEIDSTKDKEQDPQRDFEVFKKFLDVVNSFDAATQSTDQYQKPQSADLKNLSFEGLFLILDYIKLKCKISPRITCLIENLFERKKSNWIEQQQQKEKGPMTLQQIAELHNKEINQANLQAQMYLEEMNKQNYQQKQNKQPYNKQYDQKSQRYNQAQVAQVAEDKQSEETKELVKKEYYSKSDKKIDLQIGVNRQKVDNSQKGHSNYQQKHQSQLKAHQVHDKLKQFFKNLVNKKESLIDDSKTTEEQAQSQTEAVYDVNKFYSDVKEQIIAHTNIDIFLIEYFKLFWDGKVSEVNERIFLPYQLCKDGLMNKNEFLKEFSHFLQRQGASLVGDAPNLNQFLFNILLKFVQDNIFKFDDIQLDINLINELDSNDEDGETSYFIAEFIESIYKFLKKDNLHEKYKDQLLNLTKKLKGDEAESWFNKNCK